MVKKCHRVLKSFVALGLVLSLGCGKDKTKNPSPSTESPEIIILETSVPMISDSVCGEWYHNVLKLYTGNVFKLKMQLKGGSGLSQYKIDIHANFDCHVHQKSTSANRWSYLTVQNLSGKDTIVTEDINLPYDSDAGNYHCVIRLLDDLGNEADFVEFNIKVINSEDPEAPMISLSLPATDSLTAHIGQNLVFKGTVTDNHSLAGGRMEVRFTDASGKEYTALREYFPSSDETVHNFERTYEIPPYPSKGTAVFVLKAYDKYNNTGEKRIKVSIQE